MLSLQKCRLLLGPNCELTDSQIDQIRQELYALAHIALDGLMEANSKWAECRAHKYQLVPSGMRTWRFDTVTGDSCIQLTSEADWKSRKTKEQSCACTDLVNDPNANPTRVQKVCGWDY